MLVKNGIEANATRRWSRGKTIKSVSQADYHVARNRVMTNEERARIYAMSKKRNLLNHQKERMQRIADAFEIGAEIEDSDGIVQAKKRERKSSDWQTVRLSSFCVLKIRPTESWVRNLKFITTIFLRSKVHSRKCSER